MIPIISRKQNPFRSIVLLLESENLLLQPNKGCCPHDHVSELCRLDLCPHTQGIIWALIPKPISVSNTPELISNYCCTQLSQNRTRQTILTDNTNPWMTVLWIFIYLLQFLNPFLISCQLFKSVQRFQSVSNSDFVIGRKPMIDSPLDIESKKIELSYSIFGSRDE